VIIRYWRGWTRPEQAEAYQEVLTGQVVPMIIGYNIQGFRKIEMMRRDIIEGGKLVEVEFATLIHFETLSAVKDFVGEDYEVAHVPDIAQAVLSRWDERCIHYGVFE